MKLPEFSVNRRITILMLTILILILGGISFTKLGLEMFPDMDYPVISIITPYNGASSQDVEETVTKTIETAIASVKNIKNMKSESMENASLIMVEFNWGTNLDFAAQDLRDMIDQIADYLPEDVSRPLVMKYNLSQMPILMYGVTGPEDTYQLRKTLEDEVATKLKQLSGVASVMVMGGDELEKQVIVDKAKLELYNISIDEIVQIIAAGNLNMAAGYVQDRKEDFLLRTVAQYQTIDEIRDLPIRITNKGNTIYLKDIAQVDEGYKEKRYHIRTNSKPTAMMMISKESGANTITVANVVREEMKKIQSELKIELEFNDIMDMSLMISKVTTGAMSNLIIGGILAIAIMFLFLRNWRPTLAISLAIPISVVATMIPVYLAKFSLNIMTLGGLALGVGMLVDNSIVVIENIYRHMELGEKKVKAAKIGASEVAMAITASTLTTIAVFFPMIFAEGMTGILVRGLALTVAFSLAASLFVSLTIVPAIASVIFRKAVNRPEHDKSEKMFDGIKRRYIGLLNWALDHKGKTIIIVVVLLIISLIIPFTGIIGAEFMPEQDIPIMALHVNAPVGTSLEETDDIVRQIEDAFMQVEGVRHVMSLVGPMSDASAQADPTNPQEVNEAQVYARLEQQSDREISYAEIQAKVRKMIPNIEGAEVNFLSRDQMMGSGQTNPIEIKIFGKDLELLKEFAERIENRIKGVEHVSDVVNSVKTGKPEAHIVLDKDKAFKYGLTTYQIASTIKTATIGTRAGIFRKAGEETDILVKLDEESSNSFEDIMHIVLISPMGFSIPLNQVAHIEYEEGPRVISHEKQTRKVTVSANVFGTHDMGGVATDVQAEISDIVEDFPPGYFVDIGGAYKDMKEAFKTLSLALLLAIILIYIVMASQFESLRQPFIVMFTMPLAVIGVMLILGITGTTLSVVSFVGGIILAGIVVNNGIVLIDHINQLRLKGMEKRDAIIQAGKDRLRPILITAITTMTGMLPMALSTSEGAELKAPMALTVIGGLISATFLTLIFLPVIYSLIARKKVGIEE